MKEDFLEKKLAARKAQDALRQLRLPEGKIDFCSNDYLGIVHNGLLEKRLLSSGAHPRHGSGGSRLLSGNFAFAEETEQLIAAFHKAPAALLYNSGYDANIGLLSCMAQRDDTILYDYLSHASIRDGVRLSLARSFSFRHNDLADLEKKLTAATGNIFVVTESVFSMDGDLAPLREIAALCETYHAHLIVDEAHATGVIGAAGEGLVQHLQLETHCFARVQTFGKAAGCHGAAVLGSEKLRQYLINFSRSFIYTTALPETSVMAINDAYALFPGMHQERLHLQSLITIFQQSPLPFEKLVSSTPIQVVIIPGNTRVKAVAALLQSSGLDVRPILYPTVPEGSERLRIVLHAFNTTEQVLQLVKLLSA